MSISTTAFVVSLAFVVIALAFYWFRKSGRLGKSGPRTSKRIDMSADAGIAPNEITLALIRMLCRARFQRMHRQGDVDALIADANIKQVATIPSQVLMGIPEATILWICSEYLRLTQSGMPRPHAIETIEAHRASLSGVSVTPSTRTRWLRTYVADRVVAEHSEIAYSQDFAMLVTQYLMSRLTKPLSGKDEDIQTIHPMAMPIPFGVLESAQLHVETMESAIESLDRKNPTEAIGKIDYVLNGPDAAVLLDSDRHRLLDQRSRIVSMQ